MTIKYATAVERSKNKKTGDVSCTYAAQESCPHDCAFYHCGCYAEQGTVSWTTSKLNRAAEQFEADAIDVAKQEAEFIKDLTGRRDLRLHVVGDSKTDEAAKIVSEAARLHTLKYGRSCWTYSHAWRDVDFSSWDPAVAVRASCETPEQIIGAHARGYPAVLTVDEHPSDGKAWETAYGDKIVPCPEQTKGTNCVDCRLCWQAPKGVTISFAVHGQGADKAKSKLGDASS